MSIHSGAQVEGQQPSDGDTLLRTMAEGQESTWSHMLLLRHPVVSAHISLEKASHMTEPQTIGVEKYTLALEEEGRK